jgi:hypothetical protein
MAKLPHYPFTVVARKWRERYASEASIAEGHAFQDWTHHEEHERAATEHLARRKILERYLLHGYQVKEITLETCGA